MRSLQSRAQHRIEDRLAARTTQFVMRSVEFHFEQNLFSAAIRLDDGCSVFLVGQRDEALDVNSRWRNAKPAQRFERAIHECFGTAYVAVSCGRRARSEE